MDWTASIQAITEERNRQADNSIEGRNLVKNDTTDNVPSTSNEESTFDFESIDPEFLDDENWYVFDENQGKHLGIDIPAIHIEDTTIAWRWR